MATLKLSQIATSPSPPALTDTVVGVGSGTTDFQYPLSQIQTTMGLGSGVPLKVGTTTVVSGTSGFALTDNAGVLGNAQIRITLTANTNYYIRTDGSDSNTGTANTAAGAWATPQHAADVFALLDNGGFNVFVNVGAGSFAGPVCRSGVGGGGLYFIGAGSASTTIIASSGGDCFDSSSTIGLFVNKITIKLPNGGSGIASFGIGSFIGLGDFINPIDIVFDVTACFGGNETCVTIEALSFGQTDVDPSKTINITASTNNVMSAIFALAEGCAFQQFTKFVITGHIGLNDATLSLADNCAWHVEDTTNSTWTGNIDVAGHENWSVDITGGSVVTGGFPGGLGPAFFPGQSIGFVDAISSYDGYAGPIPVSTQTASYTLGANDGNAILEMNSAGANTLTIPLDGQVPIPNIGNVGTFTPGVWVRVVQTGAGATTIAGAVGVTVHNAGAVGGQWKRAFIYKRAANEWVQTP